MKNTNTKTEIIIALLISCTLFICGATQLYKAVSATNYTATVEAVSDITEMYNRNGNSLYRDYYEETAMVSYTDASGKKQTADVPVDERFQHQLPNPGDEISILVSKSGKVIEDEGYRQIGVSFIAIGLMGLVIVVTPSLTDCFCHKFLKKSKGE